MIRRPPRSTLDRSSAASDVYKRQELVLVADQGYALALEEYEEGYNAVAAPIRNHDGLSLIHISEPTRPY